MTSKLVEKQKEIEFNKVLMSNLLNRLDGERCVAGIKKKDLATHWGLVLVSLQMFLKEELR
ncbi:hypothetical protein AAHB62_26280 [Bacillus cereus]